MIELFRTSTFRLLLVYFGLFATSMLVVLGLIYWQTVVYADQQTDETIDAEITGLEEQYRQRGLSGLVQVISERASPDRGGSILYLLTDADLRPLAGNLSRWPDVTVGSDGWMRFTLDSPEPGSKRKRHVAQATSFLLAGNYQLLVGRDLAERMALQDRVTGALISAGSLTLLLGILGGVLMSRTILGRLQAINRASARVMQGDLSERIPERGRNDEFDQVARTLNAMLDKIERLMAGMRQVTDNIAHDLRSPLSRLRSRIEMTLRNPADMDHYRATLHDTIADADQLLATFSALLDIAEAEAGSPRAVMGPVDFGTLVRDLVDLYEPVIDDQGHGLTVEIPDSPTFVQGNQPFLSRVIVNLLENALKYTPSPGMIRIALSQTQSSVILTIADSGPGIPEAARERVFERFFRLESSRTTEGNGLGLSLVKAVVRLHGGTIRLTDRDPGATMPGLAAIVTLPRLVVNP